MAERFRSIKRMLGRKIQEYEILKDGYVLYLCKNNNLTIDTNTSFTQYILSSLSKGKLSKFK